MSKPWPHHPAIVGSRDGTYFITNTVYPSEAEAARDIGESFVRLAVEVPAIHLPIRKSYKAS